MKIKGAHILITGANRGIGLATAKMAAREGAHLILANRTLSGAKELSEEMNQLGAASVRVCELDLSSLKAVETFWKENKKAEIDILFNNSGQLTGGLLETQSAAEIDQMLYVNLNSLIHMTRLALPGMLQRGRGKIINHSSVSAVMPFPGASTYGASKAAVRAFTRCLQYELKDTGVTALTLITGSIDTRMLAEIPEKYGGFLDLSGLQGMSPDKYALRIRDAILDDVEELLPTGINLVTFGLATYFNGLYRKGVSLRFRRPESQKP